MTGQCNKVPLNLTKCELLDSDGAFFVFLLYASLKNESRQTQESGLETTAITNDIILLQTTEICVSVLHHISMKHFFMFRVPISNQSELL